MAKINAFICGICLLLIGAYTLHASPVKSETKEDLRAKVAATYTAEIGVRETLGANDSPEIREYLKITNVKVPAAWCAAFVSYCYTVNGVNNPRSAWSPSYFTPKRCITVKTTPPLQADVFGVYYNNLKRIAHIGFIDRWPRDSDHFITVEGNTNDNGSREGNGVYKKRRLKRTAHKIARYINMGTFKIEVTAVGGHGVDRGKKEGETVDFKVDGDFSPDAIAARFVAELKRFGVHVEQATITHWPGQESEVSDDLITGIRKGNF
jgi:hypothetical protein